MTHTSVIVCCLLIGLGGCSGSEPRPAWQDDGAPERSITPQQVLDAIPRPDPILRAGNTSPYEVAGVQYTILPSASGYREDGIASWYGTKFHGRKTSNGEDYDLYLPTAAHRSLPIPSYVRVTNLDNGESMVVRVNDRGPFHSERLIDLSYAAAVRLGFVDRGTAPVRVEALEVAGVDDRRESDSEYRYLQLGAFASPAAADSLRAAVADVVPVPVTVSPVEMSGKLLNRVRVGPLADGRQLNEVRELLLTRGFSPGQALP
ncbi:MAG: septal ring lytic transglycosylase RlpA family protein [Chromatocurvus sp.]